MTHLRTIDQLQDAPREKPRPPSLFEMLLLPLAGPAIVAMIHSKRNDLLLTILPIPFILVRVLIMGWQRRRTNLPAAPRAYHRWMGGSVAVDALSAFVLAFFEIGVVVMMPGRGGDVPKSGWYVVEAIYVVYVALRLVARVMWLRAVDYL